MKEVICIHTGQAGVQLSSTCWELFCAEHGIQADGNLSSKADDEDNISLLSFFQEVPSGQFVPRAISIDLEPTVLDEIRAGPYRKLFHPDQLISGYEDAANNFARGHYTLGKDHIDYTMNKIRKIVDMCDGLQGFFVINSYGGGTGSGFTALLLERMNIEFTKKSVFQLSVFPSDRLSNAVVEAYNTVLCTTSDIENTDLCNFFDNESVFNICSKNLDIPRPTYSNLNRVIAQVFSSMTASVRFEGCLNATLDQLITNLVPYPRIHFPVFSHAPILSQRKTILQTLSVQELTKLAFEPASQLVNVDMSDGKYMSCCLQLRGQISQKNVNEAIFDIKRRTEIQFVEWCPTGFKIGINAQPPAFIPRSEMGPSNRSATLLTNSTAISQIFKKLSRKFDVLYCKRSFLHWYVGEGMEEMEFEDYRNELHLIAGDYNELSRSDDVKNVIKPVESLLQTVEEKDETLNRSSNAESEDEKSKETETEITKQSVKKSQSDNARESWSKYSR